MPAPPSGSFHGDRPPVRAPLGELFDGRALPFAFPASVVARPIVQPRRTGLADRPQNISANPHVTADRAWSPRKELRRQIQMGAAARGRSLHRLLKSGVG